ncbi:hypothetical protein V6N13_046012 [Hibiscus sabdariffa]
MVATVPYGLWFKHVTSFCEKIVRPVLYGQRCLSVGFLSLKVSHLESQAPLKLAQMRRSHPSKVIWCLALISIQMYNVHFRPSNYSSYYCCFFGFGFHVGYASIVLLFRFSEPLMLCCPSM